MDILRKATEAQLTFLRNSGASFIVILKSGEEVTHDPNGIFTPKDNKKKRGPLRNPDVRIGEPTKYVTQFIETLEPGQMVEIPNKYNPRTMTSVCCNQARRIFGSGNYMTESHPNHTTVLRVN